MTGPAAIGAGLPGAGLPGGALPGETDFRFTAEDFRRIAAMLYEDAGISMPPEKSMLVYSRLTKRLRELGLDGFDEYCALVAGPAGAAERRKMLGALTTNVTRFFREPHHFEHLRAAILPPLLEAARRARGRVRIWSSACSTGEEPYSIALTILSLMPDAGLHDVKVLATDIDPEVIETARAGVYTDAQLEQAPKALREKWFERPEAAGGGWSASRELRGLVTFRELSLVGRWSMAGPFQAIFCRNVAIYFDDPTRARLWARFVPLLDAGGALYIGHSERINGDAAALLKVDGVTTYRRAEDRPAAARLADARVRA